MTTLFQHIATLVGRICSRGSFSPAASTTSCTGGKSIGYMESKGGPVPHLLLALAVICLLVGGVSVLVGIRARWGAILLILFLVPATFVFHNYWAVSSEETSTRCTTS